MEKCTPGLNFITVILRFTATLILPRSLRVPVGVVFPEERKRLFRNGMKWKCGKQYCCGVM